MHLIFFFLECIEDNYVTVDFSNFYIESKNSVMYYVK